jgi:ribokinase
MTITVFGSVNVDVTAYAERLPRPGETVHGSTYATGLGGKGANQAVAVARLGGAIELAGRTGMDAFGTLARERLAHFGVATNHLLADPKHPTGIAVIGVDANAENSITVIGGANMAIDMSDLERAKPLLVNTQVLLLQLEVPLEPAMAAAALVRQSGGRVILDPAPAPHGGLADMVWQSVDVMTPNETETEALVGIRPTDDVSAARASLAMIERGLPMAVVKMGATGVYWREGGNGGFVPPFKVKAIDTVAAGDCFNGGLGHALAQGASLKDAVRYAAACGALATTRRGASDSAPTAAEVEVLLKTG